MILFEFLIINKIKVFMKKSQSKTVTGVSGDVDRASESDGEVSNALVFGWVFLLESASFYLLLNLM